MGDYGLNQIFEYSELCLDSTDATTYSGNFTPNPNTAKFSWPTFFFTKRQQKVAGIKVISAQIPFVYDVINTSNNTFLFTEGGVPNTITITPGTYTSATLATELQTRLAAVSAGFTVTYSTTTLKFTFNHATGVAWSLFFGNRNTPYVNLGFPVGVLYSATGVSSIVSPSVALVTGSNYLYLNSSKIGSLVNFNLSDGNPTAGSGQQICRIPVNVAYGSVVYYNDPDPTMFFDFFAGNQFDSFDLYLTLGADQSQIPLDMKGIPWSVKLGLLTYRSATGDLYKKPTQNGSQRILQ
jgi:hypothetical protein